MPKQGLRFVIWNCNQAFHKKHAVLLERLRPDVAVISECAHPDILRAKGLDLPPTTVDWFGENRQKGLGVFTFHDYRLSNTGASAPTHKWILPVSIVGPVSFSLVAVWARYHEAKRSGEPGPVLDFIAENKDLLANGSTLIAGDFNSSVAFDRSGLGRHKQIVDQLSGLGLTSAYHSFFKEEQGQETHPTIYWRDRNETSKFNYHIDYCFVPRDWREALKLVAVGSFNEWGKLSDHMPLVFEFLAPI